MRSIYLIILSLILFNCSSDPPLCDTSPSFGPISSLDISYTSFRLSGSITPSECDDNFISKGIVYSTSQLPTTSDQKIIFAQDDYSVEVENLSPSTQYYVRAFLTNQDGEFYSSQITLTTLSTGIEFAQINSIPQINTSKIEADFNFIQGAGFEVSEKGVVLNGNKFYDNISTGNNIDVTLEGLSPDTNYTFRIFITTEYGEFLSLEENFRTESSETTISSVTSSNISYTSFDLSSTYSNLYTGDDITTDKGFLVSNDSNFTNPTKFSSNSSTGLINATISQLNTNTTYYVKAFVENNFSINYSETKEVSTLSSSYNFPTTIISNISFTTADLSLTNISPTDLDISEKGFNISTSSDFSSNIINFVDNVTTSNDEIMSLASGLIPNTVYYVRAYVTNQYGTYTSEVTSFTTTEVSYTFGSVTSSNISFESASLSSSFQLDFGTLDYSEKGFEYSTNSSFSSFNSVSDQSSGSSIVVDLSNLTLNTIYYVRAYVTNQYGTYTSEVLNIQTLNSGYNFLNINENNINYTSVNLDGTYSHINSGEVVVSELGFYLSDNINTLMNNQLLIQSGTELSLNIDGLNHNTQYYYQAFIKNQYGEFKSEIFNFNTLNATPIFNFELNQNNIQLSSVNPTINVQIRDNTDINSMLIEYKRVSDGYTEEINFLNEVDSNYSGGESDFSISQLLPRTNYSLKIKLQNDFGEFESNNYTFTTLDDTPTVSYTVVKSDDNSVNVVANFTTPDGATINRAYLEYKNQEENSYQSNELNTNENDLIIENLVQGPEYNFKLTINNQWNSYTYDEYISLPVTYARGDEMFGGVIVYIDPSGYHGIIAAKMSDIRLKKWSTNRDAPENFDLSNFGENEDGAVNTLTILNYYESSPWDAPAAEYCHNFISEGFDDWYLPSAEEFSFQSKTIQRTMYEKYGADFIRDYNYLWTSNDDSALEYRAVTAGYNGCANNCYNPIFKDSEAPVLPIRRF